MVPTDISYEITLSLKAIEGWKVFGHFQLGNQKEQALTTFESLTGLSDQTEAPLRMKLFEKELSGSILLLEKSCKLDELAENVRIITRDAFKYMNLE